MAEFIKGFNIGGEIKKIDYESGIENKPTIPTTVAELSDAGNYAAKDEVLEQISSAITDLNLSDTYAAKSYESKVDILLGGDTSKTIRDIASEEVAKIVNGADASYDTLKEISDWILSDTTGAASMANDIAALKGNEHTHSNKALLDTYTQTEENIADAVTKKHNHSNLTIIESITSEKINIWDSKQNALSDTDGSYGQRVKAIEDVLSNAINFESQKY